MKYIDAQSKVTVEQIDDVSKIDAAHVDNYLFRIVVQPNGGVELVSRV